MWARTTLSKHFIMIGVSATGLLSFTQGTGLLLGTGMMVSVAGARDRLKMEVNTDIPRLIHILIVKHIPYRLENMFQAWELHLPYKKTICHLHLIMYI